MNVLKFAARGSAPSGPQNPWDLAYAEFRTPSSKAYNVSNAFFVYDISAGASGMTGVFFKPDGTKMYAVGNTSDTIREYSLSKAWNVSSATFSTSYSVSALTSDPRDLYFSPDGTRCYFVDVTNDAIEQLSLSTAWSISTASSVRSFSVATEETNPSGVFFKDDGTKMYVCGTSGDDVNEYNLSTAWDISTASYVQNFSVSAQDTVPRGLHFTSDGTKMYVGGNTGSDVNYYTLSTAWDISTASFVSNLATGDSNQQGHYVRDDGAFMYTIGATLDTVRQFVFGDRFNFSGKDTQAEGLFFKPDGTKVYMCGNSSDSVHEYDLSTAWLISSATFVRSFSVTAKETAPFGLFFKSDGTEMYVIGPNSDSVHQYTLSTGWNISTASFTRSFSVATQETFPEDVFFKDDGTKMYVLGSTGDDINEYSLSTAWDISTASFTDTFSVATQETVPTGMFIGDNGTKLYVVGEAGDDINEYTLSTAWDVSTGSYVQNLLLSSALGVLIEPASISFNSDGSLIFVLSNSTDDCVALEIS